MPIHLLNADAEEHSRRRNAAQPVPRSVRDVESDRQRRGSECPAWLSDAVCEQLSSNEHIVSHSRGLCNTQKQGWTKV